MNFLTFNPNNPAIKTFNDIVKIANERNEMIYPDFIDEEYEKGILSIEESTVLKGIFFYYQDEKINQLKAVKEHFGDELFKESLQSLLEKGYILIDEKGKLRYEMTLLKMNEKQRK